MAGYQASSGSHRGAGKPEEGGSVLPCERDTSSTHLPERALQELFSPRKDRQLWPREGGALLKVTPDLKKAPQAGTRPGRLFLIFGEKRRQEERNPADEAGRQRDRKAGSQRVGSLGPRRLLRG